MDYSESKLKIFSKYISKHKVAFAIDMLLSLLVAIIDLAFPMVSRWTMQSLLPSGIYKTFFAVMTILLVAYLLKAYFQYLVTVIGHRMGTLVEADMRRDAFAHIEELSFSYFDKNRTGILLSRITNDLFEIVELSHHCPEYFVTCVFTLLGAVIILFRINVYLTLVIVVVIPISIIYCNLKRKEMKDANIEVKEKIGNINAAIESEISGIRVTKAFANEDIAKEKFNIANEKFKQSKVSYYKAMGKFNAGVECTVGVLQVVIIALGGYLIMKGEMNYIDLLTFSLYITTFVSPIRKLTQFMEIYAQGMAGFDRFVELMNTKDDIVEKADAIEMKDVKGNIIYKDVSFHYNKDEAVLDHVNLDIKAGETLALVGATGGGKTTISQLLPRFYDVTGGAITIDGIDIRDIKKTSLRKNIGIIQQDVFLFAGTIRENIKFGNQEASDDEIFEAARKAKILDEIMSMKNGFDTYVGERGVALSGGQKQRISIARIFLKNPPILILDEATSALDTVTEYMIQQSLNELARGKTTIIIAHRLSTIRGADKIAVVEGGKISEYGSRDELLSKNGKYAKFEQMQSMF